MDQQLLRSYFSTIYELPSSGGVVRASLDGETLKDPEALPELLRTTFAVLTAYNPRSMLLPRRVNEMRHQVMRGAVFGVLLQNPGADGVVHDIRGVIEAAHAKGALVTVATDLLSLLLLTPPSTTKR